MGCTRKPPIPPAGYNGVAGKCMIRLFGGAQHGVSENGLIRKKGMMFVGGRTVLVFLAGESGSVRWGME